MNFGDNIRANTNEIVAELNVTGRVFDPDALTRGTQLHPTKKWLAGDLIGRSSRRYEHNGWSIATPKRSEVEDALDELLSTLEEHWDELLGATREQQVELSIVVYARSFVPGIQIRADQLRRFAELNASIDVDLYDLARENDG